MAGRKGNMVPSTQSVIELFILAFLSVFVASNGCILRQYGWQPKSVEERTALADVIISGTVLRVLQHQRAWDGTYPADVLVADVYKGYELFENATALSENEIPLEYRSYYPHVYRVERFGDRRQCWAEVMAGKNYVLYLTTNPSLRDLAGAHGDEEEIDMSAMMRIEGLKLVATYDDIFGASIDYSFETEENILKILGWRPWGSWSPCNEECEGGYQTRRRMCIRDVPDACEGEAKQRRPCNTFDCSDMKDIKELLRISHYPSGVTRTPSRWTAYRISHKARTLAAPTSQIYGKEFPPRFSILLTVKPKTAQRRNRGNSYAFLFTDEDGAIRFGVKMSTTPLIVYKKLDGSLQELNFTEYRLDRSWHSLAFSVTEHAVTMIGDCSNMFTMEIEKSDRAPIDTTGMVSIGAGREVVKNVYFEGDIDQLVVTDDPATAQLQCSPQERRFPDLLDIAMTTTPLNSLNGMDASIDIDLVYENLFDPFLFIEETTSNPMDTPFPQFPYFDSPTKAKTTPSAVKSTKSPRTMFSTKDPKSLTSTTLVKHTVAWDMTDVHIMDNGDFIGGSQGHVTPGEFGANEISYQSEIDENSEISEPEVTLWATRENPVQSTTVATTPISNSIDVTLKDSPSHSDSYTVYHSKPSASTKISTTSSSKHKAAATTVQPETITSTPEITTPSTSNKRTSVTTVAVQSTKARTPSTAPLRVTSNAESNAIKGDEEFDNSERPLNDGHSVPGILVAQGAPARIPNPSIHEYGQPEDDGANWSTWSSCSRTCGTGTRYRYTVCRPDTKLPDCRISRGIAAQHKPCRVNNCRGSLNWSDWGSCSRTCGSGFETRVAICRDTEVHANCTEVGQLLIERRQCEQTPNCPLYCVGGCQNGGTCMADGFCQCSPGYDGRYCENDLCTRPCKNGGRCVGPNVCLCPYGFLPPFCEPRCNPPCQNNGRCIHPGRCVCPKGFTGPTCSRPICKTRCLNGGECIAPNQCRCPDGYTGSDCSQPQCSRPCENGGTCIHARFCRCRPGYRGAQCQIPYCRRSCLNGGKCTGADTCTCPRGHTGAQCQQSKCQRGCPRASHCTGYNRCTSYDHQSASSFRRPWCPLQSFKESYTMTYIKPAIQKYRVPCGPYRQRTCESSRIIYQIGYRSTQRTAYKCAPYG